MGISVKINGSTEALSEGTTVADVLSEKEVRAEMVAVEVNGELLQKDKYAETLLKDQDSMEFLHYMAGGMCRGGH